MKRSDANLIFLGMILLVLLIPFVLAEELFPIASDYGLDNFETYDAVEDKITFWDKGQLGEDTILAEHTLESNTNKCSTNCESIIKVKLYGDNKLMESINFIDDLGRERELNYKIEYATTKTCETIEKDNYESISKDNNTNFVNTFVGRYNKTTCEYDWKDYNEEELKEGEYYVKISGNKKATESVDWSYDYLGISEEDIREYWAWWVGTQPTAYWKFNDDATDSSGGGFDLTEQSSPTYGAGKLNNALVNVINPQYLNRTGNSTIEFGTNNFTIALWVKTPNNEGVIIQCGDSFLPTGRWAIRINSGGTGIQFEHDGWALETTGDIADDAWHRMVVVREGTGTDQIHVYLDGVLNVSGTDNMDYNDCNNILINYIGTWGGIHNFSLDDVQIFNDFAWDSDDVTTDWNSGNGQEADTTPNFRITLNYPTNTTINLLNNSVDFNCTATTTLVSDIANVSLYLDTGLNATNSSPVNNSNHIFTVDGLSSGSHNWTCGACDSAGNCTTQENVFFTLTLNITGWIQDLDGTMLDAQDIFIVNQTDNLMVGNTTSNASGYWTYGPVANGTYIVTGYDPANSSQDGDTAPHIVVP